MFCCQSHGCIEARGCVPINVRSVTPSWPCYLQPSEELQRYLAAAGPDVEEKVKARLVEMGEAVFPSQGGPEALACLQGVMALERRNEVHCNTICTARDQSCPAVRA